ncbi:MAG: hypothetical protein LQ338_001456 [Usnochroma carphineum]|nr:MAG: hypothetical protein LQ338_001456 [Usnochroma carphineum]
MSAGSQLDQIVKGAPPPGVSVPSVASRSPSPAPSPAERVDGKSGPAATTQRPADPVASLPSSPPQIYLNLLILEASLRSQFLTLRARRRQHTFFLLLLTAWVAGFFYALFLRPREDGSGVGGSVYWVVETAEKVALMGGIVTGVLLWGTGQWDRGVRWPRRWVGVANRGLRNINAKIVVIKGPWWKELFGHISFLFPYSSLFSSHEASYHFVEHIVEKQDGRHRHANHTVKTMEDLSPGGDYIKLLLLPKPFSPDFRENWEMYRLGYWEKENERRAQMRRQLADRQRLLAREQGKWFWWTGWRRPGAPKTSTALDHDVEKSHSIRGEKERKRRDSVLRTESHSRNTSRSSTPASLDGEEKPTLARGRRGSSHHTDSSERRKKLRSRGSTDMANTLQITSLGAEQMPSNS